SDVCSSDLIFPSRVYPPLDHSHFTSSNIIITKNYFLTLRPVFLALLIALFLRRSFSFSISSFSLSFLRLTNGLLKIKVMIARIALEVAKYKANELKTLNVMKKIITCIINVVEFVFSAVFPYDINILFAIVKAAARNGKI